MTKRWPAWGLLGVAVALAACRGEPTSPGDVDVSLAAVVPANGATGVNPGTPVVLEFTHPMLPGMEQYVAVHEGDVNGPAVMGQWSWSPDYRKLTFTPTASLKRQTRYTVHMGMGMMDAEGTMIGDHAQHHIGTGGSHMGNHIMSSSGGGGMMGSSMANCVAVTSFTTG